MTIDEVMQFERDNRIIDAANAYECILASSPGNLDAFINLLVIYWQSTDCGFSASAALPASFVGAAGDRLSEMLDDSLWGTVGAPEFQFWKKYISWADLGDQFEIEECYELMRRKPGYLEPSMFIYSVTGGGQAANEADKLLALVHRQCTVRDRYIYSVLMSVRKHAGLKGGVG